MKVTLILAFVLMAALFLMILVAVSLIQSKALFKSAPKDIQAAALEHEERFPGARALGWTLLILCLLTFLGAFVYGGWDGIRRGYGFWRLAGRFVVMLYLLKLFDIAFLDWFLLTKSHFFQHFYPETKGCGGYHQFGYNYKEQIARLILFTPLSLLLSWICSLVWTGASSF